MRAALALLTLVACGGGDRSDHLDVAQVALIGGVGCAPRVASGTVPSLFAVGGESVRFGLSFTDPWTFEPVADLAGLQVEVFLQHPDGHPEPQGAPIATGVVNGQGVGVVDWRPSHPAGLDGEVHEVGLIVVVEGRDPSPSFFAHVVQAATDGRQLLCAYAANEAGERVAGVGNGQAVRFRATGRDLPADATVLFQVTTDEAFTGPVTDGDVDVAGRILLPSSAFPVNGTAVHRVVANVGSDSEPGLVSGLSFQVLVAA